jgi:RepB DNA-primase from phage plasmid
VDFSVNEGYRKTDENGRENPEDALKLWRHIFGGERGLLCIFTAARGENNRIRRESIQEQYFNYPKAAQSAAAFALEKSAAGREVYFCAHLLTAAKRIKENAAEARAAWFEKDGGELPNGQLRPTAVVESSPGHYHGYLRLTDPIPPEVAEQLNKRLAHATGADPSGADLTQILRVPGSVNHKYPEKPEVRLLGVRAQCEYTPRELGERLPEVEDAKAEYESGEPETGDEPPIVLDPEAAKVWRGERPKPKEDTGEVDKSATLMKIARVLFDAGANKRVIVGALAERDRTLGYKKYSGNRDGGRREYERICEKLKAAGRNRRVSVVFGKSATEPSEDEGPGPLEMDASAYRGLFGRIVETVDPHTEGDPVAVLGSVLAMIGNAAGRGPFVEIGATRHRLNLFVALVGDTATGRKGSATDPVENVMHAADSRWAESRIASGLSSGEGLINEIRDRVEAPGKDGEMKTVDAGVSDKRVLVSEGELAQGLKVIKREGNTLSPILRNAWDGKNLRTMVKHSPLRATEPHVSILGHITRGELVHHLNETEMANGLANRFLWLLVKRSKSLPFGGEWHTVDLAPVSRKIISALEFARRPLRMTWAGDARDLWANAYEMLTEERAGLFGAITARAAAQTLRLSMLYAIADHSEEMHRPHVESALAVWEYAEKSAREIFGDATGDRDADKVLSGLEDREDGLTRTEVSELFGRNKSRDELDRIQRVLLEAGRLRVTRTYEGKSKKPIERWYAA